MTNSLFYLKWTGNGDLDGHLSVLSGGKGNGDWDGHLSTSPVYLSEGEFNGIPFILLKEIP